MDTNNRPNNTLQHRILYHPYVKWSHLKRNLYSALNTPSILSLTIRMSVYDHRKIWGAQDQIWLKPLHYGGETNVFFFLPVRVSVTICQRNSSKTSYVDGTSYVLVHISTKFRSPSFSYELYPFKLKNANKWSFQRNY